MRSDLQRSDGCLDLAGKSLMDNILRPITDVAADSRKLRDSHLRSVGRALPGPFATQDSRGALNWCTTRQPVRLWPKATVARYMN